MLNKFSLANKVIVVTGGTGIFGENNVFINNYCEVNSKGMGFYIQKKGESANGNIVYENNVVKNAEKGVTNILITTSKK
jgi:hypothetical protein